MCHPYLETRQPHEGDAESDADEVHEGPVNCPYLETRQPHEGDESNAESHAEEVHEFSVRFVLTLRLGSLTKAMNTTQSPMPRKSMSAQ